VGWDPEQKMCKKVELSLPNHTRWDIDLPCSACLVFRPQILTGVNTIGSAALRPPNYTTNLPRRSAGRQQRREFCFSGELWLKQTKKIMWGFLPP
jgi:hypothetical protein